MAKNTINVNVNITGVEDIRKLIDELQAKLAEEQPKPAYRKIDKADAKAGDFVKFKEDDGDGYITPGKYYVIGYVDSDGDFGIKDDDGDGTYAYSDEDVYEVYTLRQPEEEPAVEPLSVGDKVRLISGGKKYPLIGYVDGGIYTVNNPKRHHARDIKVQITGGTSTQGFATTDQLVKVTDAEVAEAKAELERKAESENWAKIGRKRGEFKKGDIVRGFRYNDPLVKFIGEVRDGTNPKYDTIGVTSDDERYHAVYLKDAILITPVEARFDVDGE